MRRRLEERDLRSLERRSMYSIFRPLDSNERLPREAVLEASRLRMSQMRNFDLVEALFLPALLIAFIVLASFGLPALLAFALAAVGVAAFRLLVAIVRRSSSSRS